MPEYVKSKTLGEVAYNAYCEEVDHRSPVTGDQLPPWENLLSKVQDGWIRAALAVFRLGHD